MKQRIKLNASGLKTSTCLYRFWNIVVEGYKKERLDTKPIYGVAVHKYTDTMFQTQGHMGKAREAALAAFRQPKILETKDKHLNDENHLMSTCYNLWENYITKETDQTVMLPGNKPATEVTFSIPYYEDDYIVVTLEGTIDRIIKIRNGCFAIDDWKTTSKWNKEEYLSEYSMSAQLRFYVLSLKLMAEKYPDSMLGQIGATNVGACIEGIFLKAKSCDNEYQRSQVFHFKDLDNVRRGLDLTIQQISRAVEAYKLAGIEPPKEGLLNGACKYCSFWGVCNSQSEEVGAMLLKRDFIKKEYDPLHHNDDV